MPKMSWTLKELIYIECCSLFKPPHYLLPPSHAHQNITEHGFRCCLQNKPTPDQKSCWPYLEDNSHTISFLSFLMQGLWCSSSCVQSVQVFWLWKQSSSSVIKRCEWMWLLLCYWAGGAWRPDTWIELEAGTPSPSVTVDKVGCPQWARGAWTEGKRS